MLWPDFEIFSVYQSLWQHRWEIGQNNTIHRQLLASQLFGFHKKRPNRPLKGPSWRFVFYIIIDVAQLLMVQLRKCIRHFFSVYDILQKLCNKQWATVVQNKVDFGQKRVSSHELFSSRWSVAFRQQSSDQNGNFKFKDLKIKLSICWKVRLNFTNFFPLS